MNDCLFCKLANHIIDTNIIYEDDIVTAFLDAYPDSNGHLLIVPKEHTLDLDSISDETLLHIMKVARKLKALLVEKMHCDGVTLIQNNGAVQEVKHFHLHLKPYYKKVQDKMNLYEVLTILKSN